MVALGDGGPLKAGVPVRTALVISNSLAVPTSELSPMMLYTFGLLLPLFGAPPRANSAMFELPSLSGSAVLPMMAGSISPGK